MPMQLEEEEEEEEKKEGRKEGEKGGNPIFPFFILQKMDEILLHNVTGSSSMRNS